MIAGIDRFLGLTGCDDDEVAVRKLRAMRRQIELADGTRVRSEAEAQPVGVGARVGLAFRR